MKLRLREINLGTQDEAYIPKDKLDMSGAMPTITPPMDGAIMSYVAPGGYRISEHQWYYKVERTRVPEEKRMEIEIVVDPDLGPGEIVLEMDDGTVLMDSRKKPDAGYIPAEGPGALPIERKDQISEDDPIKERAPKPLPTPEMAKIIDEAMAELDMEALMGLETEEVVPEVELETPEDQAEEEVKEEKPIIN